MPNMTGVDENGEPSWDYFHRPLGNRVERFPDECERATVEKKMISGHRFPYATSVLFPAVHDTSDYLNPRELGPRSEPPLNAPYGLEYESPKHFPNDRAENWYDRLKNHWNPSIDAGEEEPFIEVYAWTAPPALEGSRRVKIADIVLKSKLYTSTAGDQRLFFQHERISQDRRQWPKEWKKFDFEADK